MRNPVPFTRRQAVARFATAAGTLATGTFAALAVDDTEKSVRFYTRVFGSTVLKEKAGPRHYVKLGPNYVAMAPPGRGEKSQSIHHICPGVVGFDLAAAKHALDEMGLSY